MDLKLVHQAEVYLVDMKPFHPAKIPLIYMKSIHQAEVLLVDMKPFQQANIPLIDMNSVHQAKFSWRKWNIGHPLYTFILSTKLKSPVQQAKIILVDMSTKTTLIKFQDPFELF